MDWDVVWSERVSLGGGTGSPARISAAESIETSVDEQRGGVCRGVMCTRVKCQRNRNRRPSQSTSTTPARTMLTHRSSFLVPVLTAQPPITTTTITTPTITTRSRSTASASARIPGPPPRHPLPPHLLGGRTFWRALSPPPPPLLGGRCGWSEPIGTYSRRVFLSSPNRTSQTLRH